MKDTEKYLPVVLFMMLYKLVLTFESVDEILKCNQLNERYWEVLSAVALLFNFSHFSVFLSLRLVQ